MSLYYQIPIISKEDYEREQERIRKKEESEAEDIEILRLIKEREKKAREKAMLYESKATSGMSFAVIFGIGVLGVIALSIAGSGGQTQSAGLSNLNSWKPISEQDLQNIRNLDG